LKIFDHFLVLPVVYNQPKLDCKQKIFSKFLLHIHWRDRTPFRDKSRWTCQTFKSGLIEKKSSSYHFQESAETFPLNLKDSHFWRNTLEDLEIIRHRISKKTSLLLQTEDSWIKSLPHRHCVTNSHTRHIPWIIHLRLFASWMTSKSKTLSAFTTLW